jgi:hypothetical protein
MRSLGPMGRHRLPAAHPPRTPQPADEIEVATTNVAAELSDTGASHVMTTLRGHTHDASTSDPALDRSDERNHPSSSGLVEVATTNVAAELSDTGASHVMTTLRGHTHDASTSDPALDRSDERNHPSSSGLVEVATTNVAAELSDTGASHVMTTLRGHTHDASTSDPALDRSDGRNHPSHQMLGKRKRQPWKAKPCFTDLARLCFDIDNWPATAKEARLLVCSTTCCLILLQKY